ncbi:hypothetical protein PCL_08356 [Purpureocillium lilacinum]|uniref:Chromo domain-containing protein n=1 Tax=Purpureocillium lilacinum TaxID=33203 RepID=A0A2U3DRW6_PURLI|nr:hypothetical protein PCL_08356 [Purpureocillium lilacinum]
MAYPGWMMAPPLARAGVRSFLCWFNNPTLEMAATVTDEHLTTTTSWHPRPSATFVVNPSSFCRLRFNGHAIAAKSDRLFATGASVAHEPNEDVEAIEGHHVDSCGRATYLIKWKGSEDKTWEPETNLEEDVPELLPELLRQYHQKTGRQSAKRTTARAPRNARPARMEGGRRQESTPQLGQRRQNFVDKTVAPRQERQQQKWKPPAGSWETYIETIQACEFESGDGKLVVFVTWCNGQKTRHDAKMLDFLHPYIRVATKTRDAESLSKDSSG